MSRDRLRIALLTHSTNPRGGVVHALELAEALKALGHQPVVHAPTTGGGFFRPTEAETVLVPAMPVNGGLYEQVVARIADYIGHFDEPRNRRFDVFHAGDGISANALLTLRNRGLITAYARTVHHLDAFADGRVDAFERRSIEAADTLFSVSRRGQIDIETMFSKRSTLVGNGVSRMRFSSLPSAGDDTVAALLGRRDGPIILSVGGIEARKNTRAALAAFRLVRQHIPTARWVIAGGASILDHDAYRTGFEADLAAADLPNDAVLRLGPIDQDIVPALYRSADVFLFPSLNEGFGLCVLEAMACGAPVVVPRIAPFTDYLAVDDAAWCDPTDAASIAAAVIRALSADVRARLVARGFAAADRHTWNETAAAHLPIYRHLREAAYA
ncbi:MAG: MSMEG_0565 family glycosyltransferase [Ancalomicrobiaceae bacterium]|nr:MSMEG_0565 family glycosyltransferase [Ancalomicrobiaceae bacterium]